MLTRDPLEALTHDRLGAERGARALAMLEIPAALARQTGERVSRAALAMALNVVLFDRLLDRVPSGAAYVEDQRARGRRIRFDHGALRTIRFAEGPTGALPGGIAAFARILEPLGYRRAATYPLPALKMTGHAFTHRDHPDEIPQFFVSELHVEAFDAAFEAAARRVFGATADPLDPAAVEALATLEAEGALGLAKAAAALPCLVAAFDRHHGLFDLADYQTLLAQSAEAAWIATEGNAFNHATDRVEDVAALAARLTAEGYPMKARLEVSASGRVRQTALKADPVRRAFIGEDGDQVAREAPGSFFEFISRDVDPATGRLDLAFDSGNATGIFAMTRAAAATV
jgi:hypothetical protein